MVSAWGESVVFASLCESVIDFFFRLEKCSINLTKGSFFLSFRKGSVIYVFGERVRKSVQISCLRTNSYFFQVPLWKQQLEGSGASRVSHEDQYSLPKTQV